MKLGIVGLPNVGKSTLFNSLTKAGALSANYPFATIDPNVGIVAVPDERIVKLGELYHTKKVTPATIEFVDIAGLVKGASKGEGLGNQFLANIREVDAIVHVVRCFEDDNIIHVDGYRSGQSRTCDCSARLGCRHLVDRSPHQCQPLCHARNRRCTERTQRRDCTGEKSCESRLL